MKTFQRMVLLALLCLSLISLGSCHKCKGEDPAARIINNGTHKASVQIKTSGGNTVNINNVDPSTTSEYSSYAAGETTFTITVSNIDYVTVVNMSDCFDYDIAIDQNNNITTTPIDRND